MVFLRGDSFRHKDIGAMKSKAKISKRLKKRTKNDCDCECTYAEEEKELFLTIANANKMRFINETKLFVN